MLLRARDARDRVHRQHRRLARRQPLDERLVLRRPDEADQRRARLEQVRLVPAARQRHRRPHLEHHVRLAPKRAAASGTIAAPASAYAASAARRVAGPRLDHHLEAELDDLLDRLGRRRDTPLVRVDLLGDAHLHGPAAYTDRGLSSLVETADKRMDSARLTANLRGELSRFHAVSFVPEVWSQRTCPTRTRSEESTDASMDVDPHP